MRKPLPPARAQLAAAQADTAPVLVAWLPILAPELPPPATEYQFDSTGRAWRFDLCWPAARLAAEVDGGQRSPGGGRHNTDGDREKLNAAACQGWRVLRFSTQQLDRDPGGCVEAIAAALAWVLDER